MSTTVIGVAMDGLGYGTDGRLWGGEFFIAVGQAAVAYALIESGSIKLCA